MASILFGCFCFIMGVLVFQAYRKFFKQIIMVPGIVCGHNRLEQTDPETGQRKTLYREIIAFEFDGQTHHMTSSSVSSEKSEVGTLCKVPVNPNDLHNARTYSILFVTISCFLMGSGLLFIVLGLLLLTKRF